MGKRSVHFVLVVLLAIVARIVFLGNHPATYDEALSVVFAKAQLPELVRGVVADVHPPLYFLILHYAVSLGASFLDLRWISLVFGVLVVVVIYLLGLRLFNAGTAFFAGIITAFSPAYVFESTNARMYSLGLFESSLLLFFFLVFLERRSWVSIAGYIVCLTLGLYTHYYFVFMPFIFAVVLLIVRPNLLRRFILGNGIVALALAPLFLAFLNVEHPQIFPAIWSWTKIPATLAAFAVSWDAIQLMGLTPFPWITPSGIIFLFPAVGLFLSFLVGLFFLRENRILTSLAFSSVMLPVFVLLCFSIWFPWIFGVRSFIIFSPFYYLVIAYGLSRLKHSLALVGKIMLVIFLFTSLVVQYQRFRVAQDPCDFFRLVGRQAQTNDVYLHSEAFTFILGKLCMPDAVGVGLVPTWLSPLTQKAIGYRVVSLHDLPESGRLWYFRMEPQYYARDLALTSQEFLEGHYRLKWRGRSSYLRIQAFLFEGVGFPSEGL